MSEKKKILILEDSKQSVFGGGQYITKCVMDALCNNVVLFDTASASLFPVKPLKILRRPNAAFGEKQAMNLNLLLSIKLIFSLFVSNIIILLHVFFNRSQYSHIYAPTKFGLLTSFLSRVILRIPVIFHAHNVFDNDRNSSIFFLFMKIIATITIPVSNAVSASLPEKIRQVIIYNPIGKNYQPSDVLRGTKVFAVVANFMPYKGHEFLLNELRHCKEFNGGDLELRFYGDGPLSDELREIAKSINLAVKFMGFCESMEQEYPEIDCLLIPSLRPEAFSLVIGEAWLNNIFVIATNLGAHTELIEHERNGLLFEPSKRGDLCEKIQFFRKLNDQDKEIILKKANEQADTLSITRFEIEIRKIFWSENL